MAALRSITETCEPRADVLAGGLTDAHFAAQLDQVVRSPEKYTVYDEYEPIGSTDHLAFYTTKPCVPTLKSHLSHAVCDSQLEAKIAAQLEHIPQVTAYAKNDRLFLDIPYQYLGQTRRYRPDFIVRLDSGLHVLVEGKGKPTEADDAKATAARRWTHAVTTWGELGPWTHIVCYQPDTLADALAQATTHTPV